MALMGMRNVSWGFDTPPLLENFNFQIEKGERVCLLGRNGVGKSTFLKLLSSELLPDQGEVWHQQGVTVVLLRQEVTTSFNGTVFDLIAQGLGDPGKTIAEYNHLNKVPEAAHTTDSVKRREQLQHLLDADDGWALFNRIESVLSRTGLEAETGFEELSAGMKRRALFACALVQNPDILLLDEPTNHLDIEAVIWMEEFILRYIKTLVFITHDRFFLKNIATRVLELDRGTLISNACDYDTYLKRKQAALDAEEKQNREFDKKLSQEEAWIRQGVKARRTRNEGRVKVLEKMREEFRARRKKIGNVNLQVQEAEKTGKLVIEAKDVSFSHGQATILKEFSSIIMRGDKVGIIGPNGVGKTTLLAILLKEIPPDTGYVRHGTNLQIAYFDQLRITLDEHKTVAENINEGNDYIVFNGVKRHVISHLKDFLFSPQRCRMPVHVLSGGEKNRLLLAKLFTQPFNLLVLDEPTNDLDMETLELLEELLFEFSGTILLVSHDRAFLNNVVTSTMVFEGNGQITQYAGGYDDWLIQRPKPDVASSTGNNSAEKSKSEFRNRLPKPLKLTFKEQLELKELPQKIDTLEARQKTLFETLSNPAFYKTEKNEIARAKAHLEETEKMIEKAYARWEELETKIPS
ncbi:MAG: ATP-binding cassette domain-containing protein [Desulfobacterales bacterium]